MADQLDNAQEIVEAERESVVHRARQLLNGSGSDECQDCGCDIPAARRRVAPSATRCIDCQRQSERLEGIRLTAEELIRSQVRKDNA